MGIYLETCSSSQSGYKCYPLPDGTEYYKSLLTARTLAFADRIFKVRDTLVSIMYKDGLIPHYYAKISDEDRTYRKDVTRYSYSNGICTGNITLYRPKRNRRLSHYIKQLLL